MFNLTSKLKNKASFELENLGWLILALITLGILIIGILIFKDKGLSALNFIKNLFRFK